MSFQERHTIDLNIALGMVNMSFKSFNGLEIGRSKVLINSRGQRPQGVLKTEDTVFPNGS